MQLYINVNLTLYSPSLKEKMPEMWWSKVGALEAIEQANRAIKEKVYTVH